MANRPVAARIRIPVLPTWLRWGGVLGVAGVIFVLSIVFAPPDVTPDPGVAPQDKWNHLLAYWTLGTSIAYALVDRFAAVRKKTATVFVVTVTYGLCIELGQATLPDRAFEIGDAIANTVGALLALSWYLVQRRVEFVSVEDYR